MRLIAGWGLHKEDDTLRDELVYMLIFWIERVMQIFKMRLYHP